MDEWESFLQWLSKDGCVFISHRVAWVHPVLQVLRVKRSSTTAFQFYSVCDKGLHFHYSCSALFLLCEPAYFFQGDTGPKGAIGPPGLKGEKGQSV